MADRARDENTNMLMSKAAKRAFRLTSSDTLVQRDALDLIDGTASRPSFFDFEEQDR